jgi:aspartate 1-decarboxylase
MDAAWLKPGEVVHVNAVKGKERIITYVIPGERGSGRCELNGGAANFFGVGEEVHVNCYAYIDDNHKYYPRVVITNDVNEITKIR